MNLRMELLYLAPTEVFNERCQITKNSTKLNVVQVLILAIRLCTIIGRIAPGNCRHGRVCAVGCQGNLS